MAVHYKLMYDALPLKKPFNQPLVYHFATIFHVIDAIKKEHSPQAKANHVLYANNMFEKDLHMMVSENERFKSWADGWFIWSRIEREFVQAAMLPIELPMQPPSYLQQCKLLHLIKECECAMGLVALSNGTTQ